MSTHDWSPHTKKHIIIMVLGLGCHYQTTISNMWWSWWVVVWKSWLVNNIPCFCERLGSFTSNSGVGVAWVMFLQKARTLCNLPFSCAYYNYVHTVKVCRIYIIPLVPAWATILSISSTKRSIVQGIVIGYRWEITEHKPMIHHSLILGNEANNIVVVMLLYLFVLTP